MNKWWETKDDAPQGWEDLGIEDPEPPAPDLEMAAPKHLRKVEGVRRLWRCSRPGYPGKMVPPARIDEAVERMKEEAGIDTVFVLLSDAEYWFYYGLDLVERYRALGLEVRAFPIMDFSTPRAPRAHEMARAMHEDLKAGKRVAVHCSAGIGRTALAINCLFEYRKVMFKWKVPKALSSEAGNQASFLVSFRAYMRRVKREQNKEEGK